LTPFSGPLVVGNRYYDPTTDQFISVDPDVSTTDQPYAFTGDDPLNGSDPLGLCNGPDGMCRNVNVPGSPWNPNSSDVSSDWSSSPSTELSAPVQHPGKPVVVVDSQSVTVTVEADVTVAGPHPYSDFVLKTNGSVEFDNGNISLSSDEAWVGVIDGPCSTRISAIEFSCTISSRAVTIGADTVQADIVATEVIHPVQFGPDTTEQRSLGAVVGIVGVGIGLGRAVATFCEGSGSPICAP
jgi:hypothetical protein